jgi:hypothetical protein
MIAFLILLIHVVISPFKTKARLEAEIIMLRHQLNVLRRRVPPKPRLAVADRLVFVWLYRLFPSVLNAIVIVQPETIVRWHRAGFRHYWRWKSRARGGRPKVPMEIQRLIREMSLANRLWGAPRIHGELLKLGIEVAQSTVAKYMARSGRGRSQTWKTFLHNHAAGIGAMDFLIVPTVGFRLLFVLVILRHERRRLISLNVTAHPTAEWIARGGLTFASRCAPEERKPPRGSESQHGHGSDTGHTTPPSYAVTRGRSPSHRRPQPPLLTRSPRTSHTQL